MSYKQVIDILHGAKKSIEKLLTNPEDEHHRLKISSDIDRNINYLSLLTSTENVHQEVSARMQPAKTIGGKKIEVNEKVRLTDLEPNVQKVNTLREKVEASYPRFLTMESLHIKNEFEENVIRGVAKKAKMKVTKDDPEEITLDFIEEIKQNIRIMEKRNELNEEKKAEASKVDPREEESGQVNIHEEKAGSEKVGPITQEQAPEEHNIPRVDPNLTKTPPDGSSAPSKEGDFNKSDNKDKIK